MASTVQAFQPAATQQTTPRRNRRTLWLVATIALVLAAVCAIAMRPKPDVGNPRYFKDPSYNFQTLRTLGVIPADGADLSEVLETIRYIRSGDEQGWWDAWSKRAAKTEALANRTTDPTSRGLALLRAHNYYRTAEFLLPPSDAKKPGTFDKSQATFYRGLDTLQVPYEKITVPYPGGHLNAVYYPGPAGAAKRPLIVVVGGFDSTLEELYFQVGRVANERGYAVLTYEGPGQGAVLRKQNLRFTPQWEKPNGAVLDAFLATHDKPAKIVLLGVSMGGYFAPRAAAFDDRIDGVVAYDVFFDGGEPVRRLVPPIAFWLESHGMSGAVEAALNLKARREPGFRWSSNNAMWTNGQTTRWSGLMAMRSFTLAPVANRIHADVLMFAGEQDHALPLSQVADFKRSLTNARSVTSIIYDRDSGGSEHCQRGAMTLWHAALFDWLAAKFPASP
jgi:alpha-beta hydrolase superfamily lysophospholipase